MNGRVADGVWSVYEARGAALVSVHEPSWSFRKCGVSGSRVEERAARSRRHVGTLLCITVINDCTSNYTANRWTHFSNQNDCGDSEAGQPLCNNGIVACTASVHVTPPNQLLKAAMIFPPSLILSFAIILYSPFLYPFFFISSSLLLFIISFLVG